MDFFEWNSSIETGIESVDEQHKKLVAMINEFYAAMGAGKGKDVMGEIVKRLVSYTKQHFTSEEELMKLNQYSGYLDHWVKHQKMTKRVVELQDRLEAGEKIQSIEFLEFLKDWLINHIKGEDMKYVPCVKSRGDNLC